MPDILLEKYVLDELESAQRTRVEEAIRMNPALQEKLEQIKTENAMFKQNHPYVLKSQSNKKIASFSHQDLLPSIGYAFAGLMVFFVAFSLMPQFNNLEQQYNPEEVETTRAKGIQPGLKIYRKAGNGFEVVKDNTKVLEHDVLQLAYIPGTAKYGLIFSLDGNAQVTLHYPYTKTDSTQLNNNGETRLSFSYELDNALGFERFFFLTSDKPMDLQKVLQTAKALPEDSTRFEKLITEASIHQTTITLKKD